MTYQRDPNWWHGAVIYQIYPRSFFGANGDGIGDLNGIRAKMKYLADLGVDAIWISPFFTSPQRDFGYDISDYRGVDPIFGDMNDFDRLMEEAHAVNLKVMIDQVWSHTSNEHPWFLESRTSRTNVKSDWFVWADPLPDGSPPNNWQSLFGGSAWQWEPRRGQYYLHNFLHSQPDLNWHNPEVVDAVMDDAEFWLKKGVDGFRIDAVNYVTHDKGLRSNPQRLPDEPDPDGIVPGTPYSMQKHMFSINRDENIRAIERMRSTADKYPGAFTMGEVLCGEDTIKLASRYIRGDNRLHTAYTAGLLHEEYGLAPISKAVNYMEEQLAEYWPAWAFSNHDVPRVMTRWGGPNANDNFAKMIMALKFSLRGVICLYQGDELGLGQAELEYQHLRDPYGVTFYPDFLGRDGARTPIPWEAHTDHAGFTEGAPWLPVPPEHQRRAVDVQEQDPDSVLRAYQRFLKWRKEHPVLIHGKLVEVKATQQLFAIERTDDNTTMLCVFNLTPQMAHYTLRDGLQHTPLENHGFDYVVDDNVVSLPGFSAFFATVTQQ